MFIPIQSGLIKNNSVFHTFFFFHLGHQSFCYLIHIILFRNL